MSDLNRDQFEVWAESRGMDLYCSRKNIYVESETLWAWASWKASREFLVIELPERSPSFAVSGVTSFSLKNEGRNEAINEIEVSIHAAGVKTK